MGLSSSWNASPNCPACEPYSLNCPEPKALSWFTILQNKVTLTCCRVHQVFFSTPT